MEGFKKYEESQRSRKELYEFLGRLGGALIQIPGSSLALIYALLVGGSRLFKMSFHNAKSAVIEGKETTFGYSLLAKLNNLMIARMPNNFYINGYEPTLLDWQAENDEKHAAEYESRRKDELDRYLIPTTPEWERSIWIVESYVVGVRDAIISLVKKYVLGK